jgi:hypothetical protein
MLNTDVLIRRKRTRFAFTIPSCVLAALFLFGCGPSGNTGPTANNPSPNPSPEATKASPAVASNANEYSIGDKIYFGLDGNSAAFKVSGWSDPEAKHSWTNSVVSVLAMRLPAWPKPISLKMKLGGLTKDPELPSQPVEVYANDEKIADWNVRELNEYTAPIPPSITKNEGLLTITLKIPKAVSPKSLGISEDSRLLGLACMEASLTSPQ